MWDNVKHAIDWAAAGTILATIAGWLPPVAALFAIIWYSILIYDRVRYGPRR